jgi:branched-chain amino acid transport system ATP-binding protein
MSILDISSVSKHFDGLRALSHISFSVQVGEVVGIIGPNGAGKTTLFNLISGFDWPTTGTIFFLEKDLARLAPHERAQRGIARTFQNTSVFPSLTVAENVRLGCHVRIINSRQNGRQPMGTTVEKILTLVGLAPEKDKLARSLSHGHQRLLELAIALGSAPQLLLLDEPFAGLSHSEIKNCEKVIQELHNQGVTVLIVDHRLQPLMDLCDRVIVLHHGEKLAEGCPHEIQRDRRVIDAYLGNMQI